MKITLNLYNKNFVSDKQITDTYLSEFTGVEIPLRTPMETLQETVQQLPVSPEVIETMQQLSVSLEVIETMQQVSVSLEVVETVQQLLVSPEIVEIVVSEALSPEIAIPLFLRIEALNAIALDSGGVLFLLTSPSL